MSSKRIGDGGSAFPRRGHSTKNGVPYEWDVAGMTLRDYFAASALNQRKMLSTGSWYAADAAREAYEIADAMLAARKDGHDE
jgi:hypothetical protein